MRVFPVMFIKAGARGVRRRQRAFFFTAPVVTPIGSIGGSICVYSSTSRIESEGCSLHCSQS